MQSVAKQISDKYKKRAVTDVRSGDTVNIHQKIREGGKERIQNFEGLVIRVNRKDSLSASFTVRRIASGVGVEKTFLMHSPNINKIIVTKRSKVRRNYLTYMRGLTGKNARLAGVDFDKESVNEVVDEVAEAEEAKIHEQQLETYDPEAAKKAKDQEKAEAQAAATKEANKDEPAKIEDQPSEKAAAKTPAEPQNREK